jgi:PleD family two-component response regulator
MAGVTRDEGIERLSEVVNQVRQMEFPVAQSEPFRVTCSASIVHRDATIADLQALYRVADGALNQAKAAGGDRVVSC